MPFLQRVDAHNVFVPPQSLHSLALFAVIVTVHDQESSATNERLMKKLVATNKWFCGRHTMLEKTSKAVYRCKSIYRSADVQSKTMR